MMMKRTEVQLALEYYGLFFARFCLVFYVYLFLWLRPDSLRNTVTVISPLTWEAKSSECLVNSLNHKGYVFIAELLDVALECARFLCWNLQSQAGLPYVPRIDIIAWGVERSSNIRHSVLFVSPRSCMLLSPSFKLRSLNQLL